MCKIIITMLLFLAMSFPQTYCAGDQVSLTHQNATHPVGAPDDDYQVGDDFRLADWNGELNGGEYHIIFIDMSASW
jgi:hypothetical protein